FRRAQGARAAGVMSVTSEPVREPHALAAKRDERRAAGVACAAHALHDGYTDLIYVMLPVWQKEFGLGYAELGLCADCSPAPWPASKFPPGSSPSGWARRRCWRSARRSRAPATASPARARASACS